MSPTSDDAIMTAYLTKFGVLKLEQRTDPQAMLEILYMAERFEAGDDLQQAKPTMILRSGTASNPAT